MSFLRQTTLAAAAATCLLLAAPLAAAVPQPSPDEWQVVDLVNGYRQAAGVGPLGWDSRLYLSAHEHSVDMATNGCFQHDSCDGTPWYTRIYQYYPDGAGIADLVGWGYADPGSMVGAWMDSAPHRALLLDPRFKGAGAGYVDALWTLDIGTLPPVPEPGSWALTALGLVTVALRARAGRPT